MNRQVHGNPSRRSLFTRYFDRLIAVDFYHGTALGIPSNLKGFQHQKRELFRNVIRLQHRSSLQQLQTASQRLDRRLSQIEAFIDTSADSPRVSAVTGGCSNLNLLSDGPTKYAEGGRRKWSVIGVDEWIEAGKWWLMKVCNRLFMPLLANRGGYFLSLSSRPS